MTNAEARRTPQAAKGHLGASLAATLSLALAIGSLPFGFGEANAIDAKTNAWQIVSGAYDANHTTSQGIKVSDLANYSFVASDDGADDSQVRVTKTVEPTETEDEFIVHLSVDTSATSKQVTDYYTFFMNAPYKATTSNGYHDYTADTVTKDEMGAFKVDVSGKTQYGKKGTFDIYDPQGRRIVKDITLYWSQANNVTILLNIGELLSLNYNEYILMGIEIGQGSHNELHLTQEAYDLINKAIQGQTKWGDPTRLTSVTDVMGDNVEFIGGATANGGSAAYDDTTRTLTWNPAYSSSYKEGEVETQVDTETNDEGAVTKVTVTQRKWYYGVASLTYRVRLNTQADDFASSYDPSSVANPYLTNNKATLNYSYSTDGGSTYKDNSVDFPKPQVKGILYDLQVLKTNEVGTPVAGAVFKLTRTWTDSFGETHKDPVANDLVSDANGYVTVDSLPWGTYTLEETAAPAGHILPAESDRSVTFELCYTKDSASLVASTITAANHAMRSGNTPSIVNERVKTDVSLLKVDASDNTKPVSGARFALYQDNGDGEFDETSDLLDANKVGEITTGQDGMDVFEKLTVGTYYLAEIYTPSGYQLNDTVYRIDVFDVKGQAGGSVDNMIRVGPADGSNMQAPNTPNTITVADRPIPDMPSTGGPGITAILMCGAALLATGCALLRKRMGQQF